MDSETRVHKLRDFYRRHGRMPSYAELAGLFGFRSKNAAVRFARKLEGRGLVRTDARGKLIPVRMLAHVRVLGTVEAGFPSPAEEELSDTMTMDEYLIRNRTATFMLRVKGDSMRDAGIMPGDMVLAERGRQARSGDIVIAEVDGGWTMKYLRTAGGRVCLVPANPKYRTIYPQGELTVTAVVTAVVRRY